MNFEARKANLRKVVTGCVIGEILYEVNEALGEGMPPSDIVNALNDGMAEVGVLFERGRLYLPHMLSAAAGIKKATEMIVQKYGFDAGRSLNSRGTVAIGSVRGDVHDIGKSLCSTMLYCSGFEVVDLGYDVPIEDFIKEAKHGCRFIGMSALMTSTMTVMREVIDEMDRDGTRDSVVILVGGAPVTQFYADRIGADIYGETASDTVKKVSALLASQKDA